MLQFERQNIFKGLKRVAYDESSLFPGSVVNGSSGFKLVAVIYYSEGAQSTCLLQRPYSRPIKSPVQASSPWYAWFGSLLRTDRQTHSKTHKQTEFHNIRLTIGTYFNGFDVYE